jgi:hypothetical protein
MYTKNVDKFYSGMITRKGSRAVRWILTQIAKAESGKKNIKLS